MVSSASYIEVIRGMVYQLPSAILMPQMISAGKIGFILEFLLKLLVSGY